MKATLNIVRLKVTLAHMRKHPEQVDMSVWNGKSRCRTVACIAGTAAMLFAPELVTQASGANHKMAQIGTVVLFASDSLREAGDTVDVLRWPAKLDDESLFLTGNWPVEPENLEALWIDSFITCKWDKAMTYVTKASDWFIEEWKQTGFPYIDEEGNHHAANTRR